MRIYRRLFPMSGPVSYTHLDVYKRQEQGDIVYIEKLDVEADSEVKFDQVLAIGE